MSRAPDTIYLQEHDNQNGDFEWTWCADKINDEDVEYVRADTAPPDTKALVEALTNALTWEGRLNEAEQLFRNGGAANIRDCIAIKGAVMREVKVARTALAQQGDT